MLARLRSIAMSAPRTVTKFISRYRGWFIAAIAFSGYPTLALGLLCGTPLMFLAMAMTTELMFLTAQLMFDDDMPDIGGWGDSSDAIWSWAWRVFSPDTGVDTFGINDLWWNAGYWHAFAVTWPLFFCGVMARFSLTTKVPKLSAVAAALAVGCVALGFHCSDSKLAELRLRTAVVIGRSQAMSAFLNEAAEAYPGKGDEYWTGVYIAKRVGSRMAGLHQPRNAAAVRDEITTNPSRAIPYMFGLPPEPAADTAKRRLETDQRLDETYGAIPEPVER